MVGAEAACAALRLRSELGRVYLREALGEQCFTEERAHLVRVGARARARVRVRARARARVRARVRVRVRVGVGVGVRG